MLKQSIKQWLPWLMPLRKKQKQFFFYANMWLDKNRYAKRMQPAALPGMVFQSRCAMYNKSTGFDMQYQENKVFNLKLAAKTLHHLVIEPGETFSFWQLVRYADKYTAYKDGLIVINGKLTTAPGGGLCQMSNLLFWLFLHTPLTIVERHAHHTKDFPDPPSDAPLGVDATVSEGYLDLKVRNDTQTAFQICIDFDATHITGSIRADRDLDCRYDVINSGLAYYREDGNVFEQVNVIQKQICCATGKLLHTKLLYKNQCKIGYKLPETVCVRPAVCIKPREGIVA